MISPRAKRVLVYTGSLLAAPMLVMLYEPGTRDFTISLISCGVIVSLSSLYTCYGEMKLKQRILVGTKLLLTSLITLVFAVGMVVGAIIYLTR